MSQIKNNCTLNYVVSQSIAMKRITFFLLLHLFAFINYLLSIIMSSESEEFTKGTKQARAHITEILADEATATKNRKKIKDKEKEKEIEGSDSKTTLIAPGSV